MKKLFRLADRKEKLKKKLVKIYEKTEKIDEEALSQKGTGSWGKDLFIKCLVENKHY